MMDDVFAIYMMARVERYDPAVVRRELSNKKVYLFDNGADLRRPPTRQAEAAKTHRLVGSDREAQ